MLTETELLDRLAALGTEQNRKVYRRHGAGDNVFGVSYANLNKLAKEIKVNHSVALHLWSTDNHDARVLATMVADPRLADSLLLDSWVGDLDRYAIADAFSGYASRTELARTKMAEWVESDGEWVATVGWNLLASLALGDRALPEELFARYLARIEREISTSKNRVRHAMNGALIAIGLRSEELERAALAVAARIGKVVVDHGQTSCQTPDARAYIAKTRDRRPRHA